MTKRRDTTPFQVGDKVRYLYSGEVFIVSWVSKNSNDRRDQMIATERNDYSHPSSNALLYERA